jgi:hypothetical protein
MISDLTISPSDLIFSICILLNNFIPRNIGTLRRKRYQYVFHGASGRILTCASYFRDSCAYVTPQKLFSSLFFYTIEDCCFL